VAFSPDGKALAAGYSVRDSNGGGGVVLWDVAGRSRLSQEPLAVKEGHVTSVAYSPDGKSLTAGYGRNGGGGGGMVV
jgi:WD40 repeat protein